MQSISKDRFLELPPQEQTRRETLEQVDTHTLLSLMLVIALGQDLRARISDYLMATRLSHESEDHPIDQLVTPDNYRQIDPAEYSSESFLTSLRPEVLLAMQLDASVSDHSVKRLIFRVLCARFDANVAVRQTVWDYPADDSSQPQYQQDYTPSFDRFHWGAFFLAPIWCLVYGKAGTGILMIFLNLLGRIPMAGIIFTVFNLIMAYNVAVNAYEHLWTTRKDHYKTPDNLWASQTGWTIWGWIVGVIIIILNVVYFVSFFQACSAAYQ